MRFLYAAVLVVVTSIPVVMAAESGASGSTVSVTQRLALGGTGGWDDLTVDPAAHRLYLSRSDRVMVVNTLDGKLIGEVPNTSGVHGIALVPDRNIGFTSNGKTDSVTVFDLKTLKSLGEIKASGNNPDAIVYDPATQRVIVFNGHSANAPVIDAGSRTVVGTVALDGKPEFARADGQGRVFVNIEDKGEISVIDPKTATVVASWPLPGCEEPSGLALDIAHRRLFSACGNGKMVVTDADSGKHIADIPIGAGPDGAAFDSANGLVYSPNGHDGTLTIAHQDDADHYSVVATIPTQKSARTMTLDETTYRLYLPAAEFGPLPANAPRHTRPPMNPDSFIVLVIGAGDASPH